jgi:nucleoside-diphosphate-sugar epimerase
MRVLVTDGTGFVGSHTVAAIARSGHELRLLVRRPGQVPASLGPLGVSVTDIVGGDVLDEDVVSRAVEGCDAVVHAAAVYSVDPRRAQEMRRTDARAAELVLGCGCRHAGTTPPITKPWR